MWPPSADHPAGIGTHIEAELDCCRFAVLGSGKVKWNIRRAQFRRPLILKASLAGQTARFPQVDAAADDCRS